MKKKRIVLTQGERTLSLKKQVEQLRKTHLEDEGEQLNQRIDVLRERISKLEMQANKMEKRQGENLEYLITLTAKTDADCLNNSFRIRKLELERPWWRFWL